MCEQVRLQKEANRRIAELSEKAHSGAVRYTSGHMYLYPKVCVCVCVVFRNLDEKTRDVYRDNLRLSEALTLHSARVEELERRREQLETANRWVASGGQRSSVKRPSQRAGG